ncbi:MAG: hypothetical protein NWR50_02415 [Crocinitomicaceae bacterium]|nr:hypothetical protein [Crocinitomicaceae bacterium]
MKILLLSAMLFLMSAFSFSQKISIRVVDPNNIPLEKVLIVDKDKNRIDETNEFGVAVINKSKDVIGFIKKGYADRWIKISGSDQKEVEIFMDYFYQDLEEVNAEQARPENALSIDAVNIIDYFPFGEYILTLKRFKNTYYIGVDSLGKEGIRHEFLKENPRNLYMDCLGNMHVVCAEMVYQIAFTQEELIIIDEISKDLFNIILEPCVAKFGERYVMKSLTYGNQAYSLALYDKVTDSVVFYYQIDEVSARVAAEEALKLEFAVRSDVYGDSMQAHILELRRFIRQIYSGENPDVNLDFIKNDTKDARGNPRGWTEVLAQYKLFTYPIDVRSFRVGNNVAVVDFEIDTLSIYSDEGVLMSQRPFKVEGEIKEIWQDISNDNIYLYARSGGNYLIYYLNDVTGETTFLKSTRDIGFAKDYRIHNEYLYYLKVENGFYKIHRVQLPKHASL